MDDEIADVVRQHGWSAASITDHEPPFMYTVGLMQTYAHPELIVFGLGPGDAHALLSGLVDEIHAGRSCAEPGVYTIHINGADHHVGMRRVHPTQHPLYLGFAMGFIRRVGLAGNLNAMQAFWPDRTGRFPFEHGCELAVYELQSRLDLPLTPREIRAFERQWE